MDGREMSDFREAARVAEKMADFAGSVIMQLLQKQGYVEEKGVKAMLTHVRGGGATLAAAVSEERAGGFKELLKEAHIPFVEIARTDPETGERTVFFVYRDNDRDRMGEVLKKFALQIDKSCHEVDLESFGNMTAGKNYSMVTGLTKGEVYAFREAAGGHEIHFCVVADGSRYGIVADSRLGLSGALEDMCRNLSGSEGREYIVAVEQYLGQQESLVERMGKREVELSRLPVREAFCRDKEPVPEEIKKVEREAAERMKKMEIREQVMSRERADRMRDQAIDRKMGQEPDR